jgi:hypothetical protein
MSNEFQEALLSKQFMASFGEMFQHMISTTELLNHLDMKIWKEKFASSFKVVL